MRTFFTAALNFIRLLVGELSWNPPTWFKTIVVWFKNLYIQIINFKKQSKTKFYSLLMGIVVVVAGSYGAYSWYINRPQPIKLKVTSSQLSATELKKEAVPDEFRITFGGSAARLESVGKPVPTGIKMSPVLNGEWRWESDDTLVFKVAGDWPIGTEHTVTLDKTLFPKHVHLEKYELILNAPKFTARIYDTSFFQDPIQPEIKKVISEVRFSHPVEPKSFEKKIQFIYQVGQGRGRKVQTSKPTFTVSYDEFYGRAYVQTEVLPIPNYESKMVFQLEEGVKPNKSGNRTEGGKKSDVTVPGMLTHFRFEGAELTLVRNEQYEPEQVLVLSSTAEVNINALNENLQVYVLPKDRPVMPGQKKPQKNFYWTVDTVSNKILESAEKVKLEMIPTELKYSNVLSFKYKVPPGKYLYINVSKGLSAFGGYKLAESKAFVSQVPEFPKEIKVMANGSLLSLSGEKKISILARDMEYVRYRAQRLLPGQIAHFVTQSFGGLSTPHFEKYRFGLDNIAETFSEVRALPIVDQGKTQYSYFDFTNIIEKASGRPKGLFYFIAEGWDKVNNYQSGPQDERFILVTDLGIQAKKSVDGSFDLFVQSIQSGQPISAAEVQVVGKNGLPVIKQLTDAQGHVHLSSLKDFNQEKEPVVFVVTKGSDLSFLPIYSHVSQLNYSRFDIGGVYTQSSGNRIEGYMFSDRGIYRPGEEVRVGYIVKDSNWSKSLAGLNFEITVTDPKGTQIRHSKNLHINNFGLEGYKFETSATWPTGEYQVSLFVHKNKNRTEQIGSLTVKVEEFVPDRLKIAVKFSELANKGWLHPKGLKGLVNLQNLFGTPAQNRRIVGEVSLSPSYPSFYMYKDWNFHDPIRSKKSFEDQLGELTTDESGNVSFNLGLEKYESASYLLRFIAEGFEAEGGRSVLASHSVLISPLEYLIGYKAQGDLNFISKGAQIGVDLIAVNSDLDKVTVAGLKVKTVEFRQVSTLVKQSNGTYKYESVKKEYDLNQNSLKIDKVKSHLNIDTSKPGDFALVIYNDKDLELNRIPYSVAGSANLSFDLETNAELQVKLNKKDFNPGEEIEISIRAPYVGSGLITIERERVYSYKWFTTQQKSSVQKIKIPSDLEGNGYINVTFVRSLASDEIFMSPLSTGVAPFSINKSSRINKITLKVPPLVRPGQNLEIGITSEKKGKALVFAVDEGILQVAKYTTPDPLGSFYKKRALEVETRQILDLILPEFSKLALRRTSEAGGAGSLLGKNLNPFGRKRDAAVAYWSDIIDVGPGFKKLTYKVPNYFSGQLRVIAVAVSQDAMDATAEKVLAKGHFVLSPNAPQFVAPGDKFKVSVGVSNGAEGSGKGADIEVSLKTTANIKIVGPAHFNLKIDEGSEDAVSFDVEALEPLGNAEFNFKASFKGKESVRTATASIRPAAPYVTSVQSGFVDGGDDLKLSTPRKTFKEFHVNEMTVSKLPISIAKSYMNYLEKYPYGCTEQVVSRGFPAVLFGGYKDFESSRQKVAGQVSGIMEILGSRQMPEGGFTRWPDHSEIDAFHTIYAAHYLTEARERGYSIPNNLMKEALSYIKSYSEREPSSLYMARIQAYGAYILTRNQLLATKSLTTLEKWLDGYKDKIWKHDILILYMSGAYKLMKADEKANRLFSQYDETKPMDREYQYGVFDNTIRDATYLYVVSKHFPERLKKYSGNQLNSLVAQLSKSFNTTSAAISILAFEAYGAHISAGNLAGLSVFEVFGEKEKELKLLGQLFPKVNYSQEAESVKIKNDIKFPAYYSLTQAGFDKEPSLQSLTNGIEVLKEYLNDKGQVVDKIKVGEELTVRLRTRSMNDQYVYSVAIVDLLPGGFEVVLDSVDRENSEVSYVDVREDRVLLFKAFSKDTGTYEYKIKAVSKGEYQVPPIFSESMYDPSLQSKGKTLKMVVE